MKPKTSKLSLHRETLRHLDAVALEHVVGGTLTVGSACGSAVASNRFSGCLRTCDTFQATLCAACPAPTVKPCYQSAFPC